MVTKIRQKQTKIGQISVPYTRYGDNFCVHSRVYGVGEFKYAHKI